MDATYSGRASSSCSEGREGYKKPKMTGSAARKGAKRSKETHKLIISGAWIPITAGTCWRRATAASLALFSACFSFAAWPWSIIFLTYVFRQSLISESGNVSSASIFASLTVFFLLGAGAPGGLRIEERLDSVTSSDEGTLG